MVDGKLLEFRLGGRVPLDVLYIFPTGQLFNTTPAMDALERYGIPDPQGLVKPCVQGQLEQIAIEEKRPTPFSMIYVSAQHATNELKQEFRKNVSGLQVYDLERVIAKAVYFIQLDGIVGGHHLTFNAPVKEAWDMYNRWKLDGAQRTLGYHLMRNAPLAQTILDDNPGKPIYGIFGLQTADDAFVLEATDLNGPLLAHRWGGKVIITQAEEASGD